MLQQLISTCVRASLYTSIVILAFFSTGKVTAEPIADHSDTLIARGGGGHGGGGHGGGHGGGGHHGGGRHGGGRHGGGHHGGHFGHGHHGGHFGHGHHGRGFNNFGHRGFGHRGFGHRGWGNNWWGFNGGWDNDGWGWDNGYPDYYYSPDYYYYGNPSQNYYQGYDNYDGGVPYDQNSQPYYYYDPSYYYYKNETNVVPFDRNGNEYNDRGFDYNNEGPRGAMPQGPLGPQGPVHSNAIPGNNVQNVNVHSNHR
jgi:hypothetical protein